MRGPARHARLLTDGVLVLVRRLAGWLVPGEAWVTLIRVAGVLFWGGLAYTILERARLLMWPLAAWALYASWKAGEAIDRVRRFDAAFLQVISDALADRNGVVLADLLDEFQRRGALATWTVADLRSSCERLGVPLRQSVWGVDGRVSLGVHRDDLEEVYLLLSHDREPLPHRGEPLSDEPSSAGEEPTRFPEPLPDLLPGGVDDFPEPPPRDRGLERHIDDALDLFKDPE